MNLFSVLQDIVVFNRNIKRFSHWCLSQPVITQNFLYQYLYQKKIHHDMEKYKKRPRRIRIENTNICTANCSFCPHDKMTRKQGTMDMKLFRKIIDEVVDTGIESISIYGFGEPLLDKLFFDRVEYSYQKGVKWISTNTNAAFLSKEVAHRLLDSHLNEIYISFDAASEESYKNIRPGLDFDKVESNIKYLCDEKLKRKIDSPRIYLSFIECNYNKGEINAYYDRWRKLVDGISFSIAHNWAGSYSGVTSALRKDASFRDPCILLWTTMFINWEGKVQLCCMDFDSTEVFGDVTRESISDIWQGEKLNRYRKHHVHKNFEAVSLCKNCTYNCHNKSPWWINK